MTQLGLLERQPIFRSKLLGNGGSYESIQRVILVAHEMDYKNHPYFTTIHPLVEENELRPKSGKMMTQLGLLERQPIFRSKLLGNGSSYESIQ